MKWSSLLLASGAAMACGSSDVPTTELGAVVGTWVASSVDVIEIDDTTNRVDLVGDFGMQLTLAVNGNGTYRAVFSFPGYQPDTLSGVWSVTGGQLILDGEAIGSFTLSGGFILADALTGGSGGSPETLILTLPGYYDFGSGAVPVRIVYTFIKQVA